MSIYNFPSAAITVNVVEAQSAAATVTSAGVDIRDFSGPVLIVQNGGLGTGTLDGKIQDSADNVTFADIPGAVFAQKGTAAGVLSTVVLSQTVRRYVRYVGTIVTGPQLVSVSLSGFRQIT
jgi:hypothetical protein